MRAAIAAPRPAPRQPNGPGSSQQPGRPGSTYFPANGDEVTAVAHDHGVLGQQWHQLAVDAGRMDRVGRRCQQRLVALDRSPARVLQAGKPR